MFSTFIKYWNNLKKFISEYTIQKLISNLKIYFRIYNSKVNLKSKNNFRIM